MICRAECRWRFTGMDPANLQSYLTLKDEDAGDAALGSEEKKKWMWRLLLANRNVRKMGKMCANWTHNRYIISS